MQAQLEAGDSTSATERAQQLITAADRVPDLLEQVTIYTDCARTAEARGRLEEAAALAGKALAAVSQATSHDPALSIDTTRVKVQAAGCLIREGPHHAEAGRRALEGLREALTEQTSPMDQGQWATELAAAHLALGEPGEAETSARRALAVFGDPHPTTARAHILLGDALYAQGREAYASTEHAEAGKVLAGLPTHPPLRWTAMTWRALGERWQEQGLHDQAAQAFRQSLDLVAVRVSDPTNRIRLDGYPQLTGVLNRQA
jgi:tetratricopeptide (TPR) repeat protein